MKLTVSKETLSIIINFIRNNYFIIVHQPYSTALQRSNAHVMSQHMQRDVYKFKADTMQLRCYLAWKHKVRYKFKYNISQHRHIFLSNDSSQHIERFQYSYYISAKILQVYHTYLPHRCSYAGIVQSYFGITFCVLHSATIMNSGTFSPLGEVVRVPHCHSRQWCGCRTATVGSGAGATLAKYIYIYIYIYFFFKGWILLMTTKFWKPIGSSKLIRHPRWDFFAPVNSTGRGVPHPRPPVAYNCCLFYPSNARIDPPTQQLIGETCTCRYASTSATGWLIMCWRNCLWYSECICNKHNYCRNWNI